MTQVRRVRVRRNRDLPSLHKIEIPGLTIQHLRIRARETFGSEAKADHWLNRPNQVFKGKTPLAAFKSSPKEVETELTQIDHGVYI